MNEEQMEATIQNLRDAGCGCELIDQYIEYEKGGQIKEQMCLLARYRASLLDKIHGVQKKLDCLDYLIYKTKTEKCEQTKCKLDCKKEEKL